MWFGGIWRLGFEVAGFRALGVWFGFLEVFRALKALSCRPFSRSLLFLSGETSGSVQREAGLHVRVH